MKGANKSTICLFQLSNTVCKPLPALHVALVSITPQTHPRCLPSGPRASFARVSAASRWQHETEREAAVLKINCALCARGAQPATVLTVQSCLHHGQSSLKPHRPHSLGGSTGGSHRLVCRPRYQGTSVLSILEILIRTLIHSFNATINQ